MAFGQLSVGDLDPLASYKKLSGSGKSETIALEGAVDPAEYILGPGDKLEMFIWGDIELQFSLTVSPEGNVSIPGVGSHKISGLTIVDAQKLMVEKSQKSYPEINVSLNLTEIRLMKVSISGAIEQPGVYELSAVDRLSTLISLAEGLFDPEKAESSADIKAVSGVEDERKERIKQEIQPVYGEELEPSLRKISITDLNGKCRNIDYLRYQRTGDISYNPVLKGGDQVNIPRIDSRIGVIHLFGAVKIPGEYEYNDGDKLSDLIEIAGGFSSTALLSEILILRFDGNNTQRMFLDLSDDNSPDRNLALQPDDRIFVRRQLHYRQKYQVEVRGEVEFPGIYPIEDDVTKLSEIIEICGGFTDRADLDNARVLRSSSIETDDPEFRRLTVFPLATMTNVEYEFYKNRLREDIPQVVVDFDRLFIKQDETKDITLREKDIIEIPTLSMTVNVTGSVVNPGLVRYEPGKNYEYYIQQAGGYAWNARKGKIRLLKADNKVLIELKSDTVIEIGDTIFIPEKKEIDLWNSFKDILMVVSQLATIFVVIKSVS